MDNLTYVQRIVARADISRWFSAFSKHDDDIPFVCFMCLTGFPSEYFEEIQNILTEFVDDDIIKKISFYVQSRVVPYDLWLNKIISDMIWIVGESNTDSDTETKIISGEIYIVRSILFNYIKRLSGISIYACHLLLNSILNNDKLKAFHEDAFYLRSNIPQAVKAKTIDEKIGTDISLDKYLKDCGIFGISFIGTEPLSFDEEGYILPSKDNTNDDTNEDTYDGLRDTFKNVNDNSSFLIEKRDISSNSIISKRVFVGLEEVIEYLKGVSLLDETESYQYIVIEIEIEKNDG